MIEKFKDTDYLNRDEVYSCIYDLYENSESVKVYRHLTDYFGNYDEIYNEYSVLNTKEVEKLLVDFYMDNVLLDGKKDIEHLYYVPKDITTYLKCEALKAFVFEALGQKVYATSSLGDSDFVVFDDSTVVVLDETDKGALIGGYVSTNAEDVKYSSDLYAKYKSGAVDYLKRIPCESSIKNSVNRQIKDIKYNLKIK